MSGTKKEGIKIRALEREDIGQVIRLWEEVGKASRSGGADSSAWLAELRAARSTALVTYRDRVEGLAATINAVAAQLEAAVACP